MNVFMWWVSRRIAYAGCVRTPSGPGIGATVYTEDGTTVYQNVNGSYYAVDEEGNEVRINADGSYAGKASDGSTITVDKDGKTNYQGADGSSLVADSQSGTITDENGNTESWTTDASGVVHYTIVDKETGETSTYSSAGMYNPV